MSRVFSYFFKNSSALCRLTPRFRLCSSGFSPGFSAIPNPLCFLFHGTTILVVPFHSNRFKTPHFFCFARLREIFLVFQESTFLCARDLRKVGFPALLAWAGSCLLPEFTFPDFPEVKRPTIPPEAEEIRSLGKFGQVPLGRSTRILSAILSNIAST
jgi:hypothetical protein